MDKREAELREKNQRVEALRAQITSESTAHIKAWVAIIDDRIRLAAEKQPAQPATQGASNYTTHDFMRAYEQAHAERRLITTDVLITLPALCAGRERAHIIIKQAVHKDSPTPATTNLGTITIDFRHNVATSPSFIDELLIELAHADHIIFANVLEGSDTHMQIEHRVNALNVNPGQVSILFNGKKADT